MFVFHNPVKSDLKKLSQIAFEAKQPTGYLSQILAALTVPVLHQLIDHFGANVSGYLAFKRR